MLNISNVMGGREYAKQSYAKIYRALLEGVRKRGVVISRVDLAMFARPLTDFCIGPPDGERAPAMARLRVGAKRAQSASLSISGV